MEMKPYRLRPGKSHNALGDRGEITEYTEGEVINLTDAQYESFRDKFEPMPSTQSVVSTSEPSKDDEPPTTEESEDNNEDDDNDDDLVEDEGPEEGSDEESPIAIRRRKKEEKRAAKKAARDAKKR
jgi:hypothetical protein